MTDARTETTALVAGQRVLAADGGSLEVSAALAAAFAPGDRLLAPSTTGELLLLPRAEIATATEAVDRAVEAFAVMAEVTDAQIEGFFAGFAGRLQEDSIWERICQANAADVLSAASRGRSTTRLKVSASMRGGMVDGLRRWSSSPSRRGQLLETVRHPGFRVELVGDALGVVGFVFEGRPNVLADACGVLRGGNTVVFRIGGDALGTARAIMDEALRPALAESGLPSGAVSLVDSTGHAAGWALFADRRLGLAVARGSGEAVELLGSIARAAGTPVSQHGTGGAWLALGSGADPERVTAVVERSLDRKVCNTLNTVCVPEQRASDLVPAVVDGLVRAAASLSSEFKLWVVAGSEATVPESLFERRVALRRAAGVVEEAQAEILPREGLAREFEWEQSPEISLVVVSGLDEAVDLCNRYSPHFVASLITDDEGERERFWRGVDAPFVGDDHTRWVDGQYALGKAELGLSNWQAGRLFARGGVLSGDSVYTVRARYVSEPAR